MMTTNQLQNNSAKFKLEARRGAKSYRGKSPDNIKIN